MIKDKKAYSVEMDLVGKEYLVYHRRKPTLISTLLNLENSEKFWAVKNFTLKIKKGEKVGIVGSNGSGKTTLLKLIAGISSPTKGNITTCGKVVSLLDPNAGFHPDFTGLENIKLNGLLLGMESREISEKTKDIINFADIGKFIDAPFYTYSTGMRLRLGFSVCIYASADIYLFDETIFAGDQYFIQKIKEKFKEIFSEKDITLIATTHVPELIEEFCKKCIWVEKGKLIDYGNFNKVVGKYKSMVK